MGEEERREALLTEEELLQKQEELAAKEQELEKKESVLKKAEDRIANAKHNLYARIDVSMGTMNKVVAVLSIALVIAIFAGIFMGG